MGIPEDIKQMSTNELKNEIDMMGQELANRNKLECTLCERKVSEHDLSTEKNGKKLYICQSCIYNILSMAEPTVTIGQILEVLDLFANQEKLQELLDELDPSDLERLYDHPIHDILFRTGGELLP